MPSVWYDPDCDALWVGDVSPPFPPRSLVAELDGGQIAIRPKERTVNVVWTAWDKITDRWGAALASPAETLAYLEGEFGRRRATGDTYTVGIDIAEPGQTVIPLQAPPSALSSVRLVVNGVEYRAPDIAASSVAVTWLNPAFALDPSDRATLVYS